MLVVRSLMIVLISFVVAAFITSTDTSVLDGLLVQALSIIAGVAVAAAFFFLQGIHETAERVTRSLTSLRQDLKLPEMNAAGRKLVRAALDASGEKTYKNACLILMCTLVYVGACIWNRVDLPILTWPLIIPMTKLRFIHGIAFSAFTLSLAATYDIISSAYLATKLGRMSGSPDKRDDSATGEASNK